MPEWLKTCIGMLLGIVGLAICASFLLLVDYQREKRSMIQDTFCPQNNSKTIWAGLVEIVPPPIKNATAIIIDSTDRIDNLQRNEIKEWIQDEFVHSLSEFEMVTIHSLSDFSELETPVFARCAPPIVANPWVENPRLMRQQFEEGFLSELLNIVSSLAEAKEADSSPILEALERVSRDADRVIIISDLMHNTDDFSLYSRNPQAKHDYQKFSLSEYAKQFGSSLAETDLSVLFIPRHKLRELQNSKLFEFWNTHMKSNEGQFSVQITLSTIH